MKEVWLDVVNYEGIYKVSNLGNVKALPRTRIVNGVTQFYRERILKPNYNRAGYVSVMLYKNGIQGRLFIHRLVAEAFIPNPNNLPEINHKDENPSNNCIDNLEWCDSSYNKLYGNRGLKYSETMRRNGHYIRTDSEKSRVSKSLKSYISNNKDIWDKQHHYGKYKGE